jgi:hypothetical protein
VRAQQILVEIAARRQKKVFEWTYSSGIVPAGASIQSQKGRNPATKEPLAALDRFRGRRPFLVGVMVLTGLAHAQRGHALRELGFLFQADGERAHIVNCSGGP